MYCFALGKYKWNITLTDSEINKTIHVYFHCRTNSLLHLCDDNNQTVSLQEGAEGVTSAWLAKRAHIANIPSNKFHTLNFRHVMAFILNNIKPV